MSATGLATAADYSEAIGVVRRAKSIIALLLLLMLVLQVTAFFLIKYKVLALSGTDATTQPSAATIKLTDILHYVTGVTLLGGIALSVLLAAMLCMIGHIMLVGRLIGVGKVASSLVWTLVLIVFLFPWQAFLDQRDFTYVGFIPSGVLWTWQELTSRVFFENNFTMDGFAPTFLAWFRFAGAPVVAIIITLLIQLKSNRGIRMAMGEDEILNQVMNEGV